MKKVIFVFVISLISCVLMAQTNTEPESFKFTLPVIMAILTGIYEVLARIIPTKKVWSIVGKVLEVLNFLSNTLDRKKR